MIVSELLDVLSTLDPDATVKIESSSGEYSADHVQAVAIAPGVVGLFSREYAIRETGFPAERIERYERPDE